MMIPRPNFFLLLICACGAVNVLFYSLTNDPTVNDSVTAEIKFIELQETESGAQLVTDDVIVSENRLSNDPNDESDNSIQHAVRKLTHADITETQAVNSSLDEGLRTFMFDINKYDVCLDNGIERSTSFDIVIIVMSDINNFLRRHAIRNTWGSVVHDLNATLLFLVGKDRSRGLQSQIEKESELYNDVIQVDIIDSYENLSLKSIAMLQFLNDYCMCSKYYLKTDDDVYINIENVLKTSKSREESRFFLCHVFDKAEPIRNPNSKWFTSYNDYNETYFPRYCSGTAYAFSSGIITDLYKVSLKTKLLLMEDVFITGFVAKTSNVSHIHDDGFSYMKRPATGCMYENVMSGHQVTVKQMYVIFSQLTSHEIDCETQINKVIQNAEEIDLD